MAPPKAAFLVTKTWLCSMIATGQAVKCSSVQHGLERHICKAAMLNQGPIWIEPLVQQQITWITLFGQPRIAKHTPTFYLCNLVWVQLPSVSACLRQRQPQHEQR